MTPANANTRSSTWTLRLFTLLIWLLVGLCAAYWAFKFVTSKPVEATAALATPTVAVDSKAVAKLLGATDNAAAKPTNPPASTKFVLFGLANSAGGKGIALIALDGKPAKPYRVGSLVADDLVLKSISKTGVMLATSLKAPDGVTLELPERKPASIVSIAPRPSNPAVPMAQSPAIPPLIQPSVPAALPTAATVGASERPAAISRFAPQMADGMVSGRAPANGTSSAVDGLKP
jgi:general secretion pathway protein C